MNAVLRGGRSVVKSSVRSQVGHSKSGGSAIAQLMLRHTWVWSVRRCLHLPGSGGTWQLQHWSQRFQASGATWLVAEVWIERGRVRDAWPSRGGGHPRRLRLEIRARRGWPLQGDNAHALSSALWDASCRLQRWSCSSIRPLSWHSLPSWSGLYSRRGASSPATVARVPGTCGSGQWRS